MNNDSWNQLKQIIRVLVNHIEISRVEENFETTHLEEFEYAKLNQAFLLSLAGDDDRFSSLLPDINDDAKEAFLKKFYRNGLNIISKEIQEKSANDPDLAFQIDKVFRWISSQQETIDEDDLAEQIWSLFFPEGVHLRQDSELNIENLRKKRLITSITPNPNPIQSPHEEVLFTSNILLTRPLDPAEIETLDYNDSLAKILHEAINDKQLFWYDHPIPIGIEPEKNEVLYGMKGLNDAVAFEKKYKNLEADAKITCVLSASVTHDRLHEITKQYLEGEFQKSEPLENIDLYIFTETETQRLIKDILVPAVTHYLNIDEEKATDLLQIIGVDGMYGRHYSFLKAINAFWFTFIDSRKRATFKIDLDQIFSQEHLVKETGKSAFEHLCSPLWGGDGFDYQGKQVHLGMIAGALVNEKDISKGLFTPDVLVPENNPADDEFVFFSKLPQAISTQAEMMTRYDSGLMDGEKTCIERIHVTGGTNGVLVESLFRYRPFTPSFFGRAEDQAYILSTFNNQDTRLAYLHASGLIMRHDKEAFAQEAMEAAAVGKLIGDYTRILLFSAYAGILDKDVNEIKELIDPFSGSFVSKIPLTVVYLRFALKAAAMFARNKTTDAKAFITDGAERIQETIHFINYDIKEVYEKEASGWGRYYDALEACNKAINDNDDFVLELKKRAQDIIQDCRINFQE